MAYSLIPTDNPNRAIRLRRQLMALYSYCLVTVGALVGMHLGLIREDAPLLPIFGALFLFNLYIFLTIRYGWSELFRDPSQTKPQMIAGIIMLTFLLHYCLAIRGIMTSIYFMIMTFGIFALSRREMIIMSAVVATCFAILQSIEWYTGFRHNPQLIVGELGVLVIGLAWFVYVGGYIHNLQNSIRQQRENLTLTRGELEHTNAQLQMAYEKLERIAIRDELTGLYNRRHLLERLKEQLNLAERHRQPLFVAMIDLDHFKRVNDTYGHAAGDAVLVYFSQVAQAQLRRSDFISRYGGEEFIITFQEGDEKTVAAVVDRLRDSFAAHEFDDIAKGLTITLSAGITGRQAGDDANAIITRADNALYNAKTHGRNCVHLYNDQLVT